MGTNHGCLKEPQNVAAKSGSIVSKKNAFRTTFSHVSCNWGQNLGFLKQTYPTTRFFQTLYFVDYVFLPDLNCHAKPSHATPHHDTPDSRPEGVLAEWSTCLATPRHPTPCHTITPTPVFRPKILVAQQSRSCKLSSRRSQAETVTQVNWSETEIVVSRAKRVPELSQKVIVTPSVIKTHFQCPFSLSLPPPSASCSSLLLSRSWWSVDDALCRTRGAAVLQHLLQEVKRQKSGLKIPSRPSPPQFWRNGGTGNPSCDPARATTAREASE